MLSGSFGYDRLTGGADSDMFLFRTGQGHDVVTDFQRGVDLLNVIGPGRRGDVFGDDGTLARGDTRIGSNWRGDLGQDDDPDRIVWDPNDSTSYEIEWDITDGNATVVGRTAIVTLVGVTELSESDFFTAAAVQSDIMI